MGIFSTIRPSSPHSSTYTGYPEDMDDWTCAQWKQYYISNKSIVGKEQAIFYFTNDVERVGMFADLAYCKYDCDWINFFKEEGLNPESLYTTLFCGISNVTSNTIESVEAITKTTKNISAFLIPIALVGGAFYLAEQKGLLKKYIK